MNFPVFVLDVSREGAIKGALNIHLLITAAARTSHSSKLFNGVDCVVLQAGLAEGPFVPAVSNKNVSIDIHFLLTDFAMHWPTEFSEHFAHSYNH
jgi:hypothetical protein